jgi:putative acetyltransferase
MNRETVHRLATLGDAKRLFEMRRESIIALAPRGGMPVAEAELWAASLTSVGMKRKLHEWEVWVVELDDVVVGWGAICGDCLEALYVAPDFACHGVGSALLDRLEALMRERGIAAVCAEASSNAKAFYLRRGYQAAGLQTPDGAWPLTKQLS